MISWLEFELYPSDVKKAWQILWKLRKFLMVIDGQILSQQNFESPVSSSPYKLHSMATLFFSLWFKHIMSSKEITNDLLGIWTNEEKLSKYFVSRAWDISNVFIWYVFKKETQMLKGKEAESTSSHW